MQDVFGQTTTLISPATLDSWNKTQLAFLARAEATPGHLAETLETDPHFALGHAIKAMFYLLLGRRELVAPAKETLAEAQTAMRERPVSTRWLSGSTSIPKPLLVILRPFSRFIQTIRWQ